MANTKKRKFLEALHSTMSTDLVNEHGEFPPVYLPLFKSLRHNRKNKYVNLVPIPSAA